MSLAACRFCCAFSSHCCLRRFVPFSFWAEYRRPLSPSPSLARFLRLATVALGLTVLVSSPASICSLQAETITSHIERASPIAPERQPAPRRRTLPSRQKNTASLAGSQCHNPSRCHQQEARPLRHRLPHPRTSSPVTSVICLRRHTCLTGLSHLNSAIVTISVGPNQRLFAAHEDILSKSTPLNNHIRAQFFSSPGGKRIELPNEEPEIFSAVLEFLYKGDYSPKLVYDKKRSSWYLDSDDNGGGESTILHGSIGGPVLKDTVIYVYHKRPYIHMMTMLIPV